MSSTNDIAYALECVDRAQTIGVLGPVKAHILRLKKSDAIV
jgi:hypothetical protein